mgnify:CR=1 FL=1
MLASREFLPETRPLLKNIQEKNFCLIFALLFSHSPSSQDNLNSYNLLDIQELWESRLSLALSNLVYKSQGD